MKDLSLIFLTGFSGSGKSTIGPLLANSLGYEFIDLDHAIEQSAGKSITRIFAEEGEPAFRLLELETLQKLAGKPRWSFRSAEAFLSMMNASVSSEKTERSSI